MRKKRGFLLIATLLIAAALFFYALSYVELYRAERALTLRAERNILARAAARAGIDAAAAQLKNDSRWTAGIQAEVLPKARTTYTVRFGPSGGAPYSTNNAAGSATVTGWNNRLVPAGMIHLVSVGAAEGVTQVAEAMAITPSAPYGFPLFGTQGGTIGNNTITDSYDSTTGAIVSQRGNIGTNSVTSGTITLGSGSVVNGKVRVGPRGTSSVITGSGTHQGLEVPVDPWPIGPVMAPGKMGVQNVNIGASQTLAPGRYKDLNTDRSVILTLQAGNYVFRNFDLGDSARIVLASGPVNIYTTGRVRLGASSQVNVSGKPANLSFLGASTGAKEFRAKTGAVLVGTMYAPYGTLTLETGTEAFGSFLASRFVTQDRVKVHFDQTLGTKTVGFGMPASW